MRPMRWRLLPLVLTLWAAPALACNQGPSVCSFTLVNNTGMSVEYFWASPTRVNSWEENLIPNRLLQDGGQFRVSLNDGRPTCIYDFRFQLVDGRVVQRRGINVCRLGRFTLND